MHIYPDDRVLVFVDGPNLYATVKALGFDMDYRKLLAFFRERCKLVRALYYTTYLEQQEFSSLRPLVDWLEYNGFTLVTKPAKEIIDSTGRRRFKGSMRIELAVDALRLAQNADHIVIFTGDGDFRALVAALQQNGKRVTIVSTLSTQPQMIADDLRRQADQVVDLADLRPMIERAPSAKRPSPSEPHYYDDGHRNGEPRDGLEPEGTRDDDADRDRDQASSRHDSSRPAVVVERRARPRTGSSDRSDRS